MCQIGFGGNLKWMGILACNLAHYLFQHGERVSNPTENHTSRLRHRVDFCGGGGLLPLWGKKMLGGIFKSPEKIANAWFDAGHQQYQNATNMVGTTIFRVAGYPECMDDSIQSNVDPTSPSSAPGNLTKVDQQVYP